MRAFTALAALAALLLAGQVSRAHASLIDDEDGESSTVDEDPDLDGPADAPETQRVVAVKVHVFKNAAGERVVTDDRVAELIAGLNAAHTANATPFVFELAAIDELEVADKDYALSKDSHTEYRLAYAREALREPNVLHLYLVSRVCDSESTGWAYLPDTGLNAVFLRPASSIAVDVLVHEVGHWLGLKHVHERGCKNKDGVDDTPAQQAPPKDPDSDACAPDYVPPPPYDCTATVDSCPDKDGVDSIDNYMGYWAGCMRTFTPGQIDRMTRTWDKYRRGGKGDEGGQADVAPGGCATAFGARGTSAAPLALGVGLLGVALVRRRRRRA